MLRHRVPRREFLRVSAAAGAEAFALPVVAQDNLPKIEGPTTPLAIKPSAADLGGVPFVDYRSFAIITPGRWPDSNGTSNGRSWN